MFMDLCWRNSVFYIFGLAKLSNEPSSSPLNTSNTLNDNAMPKLAVPRLSIERRSVGST